MRALSISESSQDIIRPKSKEEILSSPEFWKLPGETLLKYGLKWEDLKVINAGLLNLGNKYGDKILYDFSSFLRSRNPQIRDYIKTFLLKNEIVDPIYILLAGIKTNDLELIKKAYYLLKLHPEISTGKLRLLKYLSFDKLGKEQKDIVEQILKQYNLEDTFTKFLMQTGRGSEITKFYPSLEEIPRKELSSYLTQTGSQPKKGYKLYKILEFIYKNDPSFKEIQKFAYEFTYGPGTFDPSLHRGYYSTNLSRNPIYDKYGKYLEKNEDKTYSLSREGYDKMIELKNILAPQMPRLFK